MFVITSFTLNDFIGKNSLNLLTCLFLHRLFRISKQKLTDFFVRVSEFFSFFSITFREWSILELRKDCGTDFWSCLNRLVVCYSEQCILSVFDRPYWKNLYSLVASYLILQLIGCIFVFLQGNFFFVVLVFIFFSRLYYSWYYQDSLCSWVSLIL